MVPPKIILKTINFFPLIISSFFIFESVANTSIKSAIVVFGTLLVTFIGKLINNNIASQSGDAAPAAAANADADADGDGDNKEVCEDIFGMGFKPKNIPEINTLIFSFIAFYVNGSIFEGEPDSTGKQVMILLFLHFLIIYNGMLKKDNCGFKLTQIAGSYIFGIVFAFIFYYIIKAISVSGELHYNNNRVGTSGTQKCGLSKKKKFKCHKKRLTT